MKRVLLAMLGVYLAGCEAAPISQEPIAYRATRNLNENGSSSFVARSTTSEGGYKEIAGVPCELKADGFSSSFVTPAMVITPNMGPRTPVASLTCNHDGQRFFQILQPINDTTTEIDRNAASIGANAGLIGVIVSGVAASSQRSRRDATLDVYGYPDVNATFE